MLDPAVAESVSRIIAHDRYLLLEYPDSLGSILLARTLDLPLLADLRKKSWSAEVHAMGRPFIRSLQPLTLPSGLLATLYSSSGPDLTSLNRAQFSTDLCLTLTGKERLMWHWQTGEICPAPDEIAIPSTFPRGANLAGANLQGASLSCAKR